MKADEVDVILEAERKAKERAAERTHQLNMAWVQKGGVGEGKAVLGGLLIAFIVMMITCNVAMNHTEGRCLQGKIKLAE